MKNKTLGGWLLGSFLLAIFTTLADSAYVITVESADFLYMVAGLGLLVFGIWASVRLLKDKEN